MTFLFIDDPAVSESIASASAAALERLTFLFPELDATTRQMLHQALHSRLSSLLTASTIDGQGDTRLPLVYDHDAFGDRFDLEQLPLARPGTGYAVQALGTDTLLDRCSLRFLPIRSPELAGLFDSFDAAYQAARDFLRQRDENLREHPLAIVPAYLDAQLQRHVLIYGVLHRSP